MEIKDSRAFIFYAFDVAYEIAVERIEKVLGKKPIELQLSFTKTTPKYIKYSVPPYKIQLGKKTIEIENEKYNFDVSAKIFNFGVISICFEMQFKGSLKELRALSSKLSGSSSIEKEAKRYSERIKSELKDIIIKERKSETYEDYLIFYIKEFDKKIDAKELLKEGKEIAKILLSEGDIELSEDEVARALKDRISYTENDIAIIDWNAALIYDPKFALDTVDVLEYAVVELLEFRSYDEDLDLQIDKAYDEVSKEANYLTILISPFSSTIKELETTSLDITDTSEKVENALKLIGDEYLAKLYQTATAAFYIDDWKKSVRRKLDVLDKIYSTIYNRIQTDRFVVLELLIVLLILLEIVVTFK
jgi:hypothetical protein